MVGVLQQIQVLWENAGLELGWQPIIDLELTSVTWLMIRGWHMDSLPELEPEQECSFHVRLQQR